MKDVIEKVRARILDTAFWNRTVVVSFKWIAIGLAVVVGFALLTSVNKRVQPQVEKVFFADPVKPMVAKPVKVKKAKRSRRKRRRN